MNKEEFRKSLFNLSSLLMFALGLGIGACLILYPLFLLFGAVLLGILYIMWKKREGIEEMLEKPSKKGDQSIDAKKEKFMREMEEYMERKQKNKKKEERISETE